MALRALALPLGLIACAVVCSAFMCCTYSTYVCMPVQVSKYVCMCCVYSKYWYRVQQVIRRTPYLHMRSLHCQLLTWGLSVLSGKIYGKYGALRTLSTLLVAQLKLLRTFLCISKCCHFSQLGRFNISKADGSRKCTRTATSKYPGT